MAFQIASVADLLTHGFDDVIDVRSPSEFAEDHLPGAINLPALDDDERAEVGTIYTQESPFRARKIGAAKVARNVASHLDGVLADKPGGWRPLVYCWRGGQRSGSVASILTAVGWRADVIEGGYRSYRRAIVAALYDTPVPHRFVVLDGNTGTAKTELLKRLQALGAQVIDLEGLANHRGSMLGERPGGQPSQKALESEIALELATFDPKQPVLVEAESSKIGSLMLPPMLWQAMCAAPRIDLLASLEARASYLSKTYVDGSTDVASIAALLEAFRRHQGGERVEAWQNLARANAFAELAREMIEAHYDPAYGKSRARHDTKVLGQIEMGDLSGVAQDQAAQQVIRLLDGW